MRVFISAGEASGDALGASLVRALREEDPSLVAFGMGGPRMAEAGVELMRRAEELNVVGIIEVMKHLPRLFRLLDKLARAGAAGQPDVAVLIDAPDFHVRLARRLRKRGIPTVGYVAPSVWAWRRGRIKIFRRVMSRMLVLFPFELDVWRTAGVPVTCVGHPMQDEIQTVDLADADPATVALLPGSRRSEIERHLPTMLDAAERLRADGTADRFVLVVAPSLPTEWVSSFVADAGLGAHVEIVDAPDPEHRRRAIARASAAMVASGTATLETALLGRPQVIGYRVHPVSYWIGRLLLRVPFIGLPNLIAERRIAEELLQGRFTAERLANEVRRLLTDAEARAAALEGAREVRERLGPSGAARLAADAVREAAAPQLPGERPALPAPSEPVNPAD